MQYPTDDIRIKSLKEVLPPIALMERYPLSDQAAHTVFASRQMIHRILAGKDDRLLIIIGPCSINDPTAAVEYGEKLISLRKKYSDDLEIIMRVYFEKPRTTVGWKGLINDPFLDNSFQINDGLRFARKLLLDLNDMGMPTGTEFLDMITPQYIADLMSWGAIGARTTESQVHRELASGLSCPVGFKNGTDGTVATAIDAIGAAKVPHHFLSVTKYGHSAIVETVGNSDCHIILRGGNNTTNFNTASIRAVRAALNDTNMPENIMIDFSHANCHRKFKKQLEVCNDVCQQLSKGESAIFGVMVESNLVEGSQKLVDGKVAVYGQSITDACLGWSDTEKILEQLAVAAKQRKSMPA
jgi:3-deoxy-7-phosphoheptulonate synthase